MTNTKDCIVMVIVVDQECVNCLTRGSPGFTWTAAQNVAHGQSPNAMPLKTTVIGSYPKPEYLHRILPDWFENQNDYKPDEYSSALQNNKPQDIVDVADRALKEVIDEQNNLGLDVITDGELTRENYIFYFCRHIKGIDFIKCNVISVRNGACVVSVPVIRQKVAPREDEPWCWKEWKKAQEFSKVPVKFTLPGPTSIVATTDLDAPGIYNSREDVSRDLIPIINREVLALAAAGCRYIQIDEAVFMRQPQTALDYGIDHMLKCFNGIGPEVQKILHMCCGYPHYLDQEGYPKSDKNGYKLLARKLDEAGLQQISLEDAHCHNDLELFSMFKKTTLIVGVIKIASSKIETEADIEERVREILQYVSRERLILAPDCGLGFLVDKDIRTQKLKNLVAVAQRL